MTRCEAELPFGGNFRMIHTMATYSAHHLVASWQPAANCRDSDLSIINGGVHQCSHRADLIWAILCLILGLSYRYIVIFFTAPISCYFVPDFLRHNQSTFKTVLIIRCSVLAFFRQGIAWTSSWWPSGWSWWCWASKHRLARWLPSPKALLQFHIWIGTIWNNWMSELKWTSSEDGVTELRHAS